MKPSSALCRRILTQLNRQEFRHRLARRVCHGERGEIRKAHRHEQEEQLGALGLTLNAIALWNSTYVQAAITKRGVNKGILLRTCLG